MKGWNNIVFKDFITLQRGFDLPKNKRKKGIYPVVASTSITGKHNDYKVEKPCVATGRSGTLGEVLFVDSKCWPLNTTLWVKNFKGNDSKFVYYKLKTLDLKKYNSGAGVPTLNRNHLNAIRISIPDISVQKKMVSFISKYDSLIENNQKRIKILEEMTQRLYAEWFVKYKFPGHEKVKLVDSETEFGIIPGGWEVSEINRVANINGLSVSKKNAPDKINYVSISDVSTGKIDHQKLIKFDTAPSRARRIVKHGDIIWSTVRPNRKSYSLILQPDENYVVSTGFVVLSSKNISFSYLYQWVTKQEFVDYLVNNAKGSAYPAVSAKDFESAKIIIPPREIQSLFADVVDKYYEYKKFLEKINLSLSEKRDLLIENLITRKRLLKEQI